jgi:hypothetical protein
VNELREEIQKLPFSDDIKNLLRALTASDEVMMSLMNVAVTTGHPMIRALPAFVLSNTMMKMDCLRFRLAGVPDEVRREHAAVLLAAVTGTSLENTRMNLLREPESAEMLFAKDRPAPSGIVVPGTATAH